MVEKSWGIILVLWLKVPVTPNWNQQPAFLTKHLSSRILVCQFWWFLKITITGGGLRVFTAIFKHFRWQEACRLCRSNICPGTAKTEGLGTPWNLPLETFHGWKRLVGGSNGMEIASFLEKRTVLNTNWDGKFGGNEESIWCLTYWLLPGRATSINLSNIKFQSMKRSWVESSEMENILKLNI